MRGRSRRADSVLTTPGAGRRVCYLGAPVGLKRLFLLVVLAVAAAAILLAPGAAAGNYDEERMGCEGESPATCPTGTEGQPYSIPIEMLGDEDEGCTVHQVSSGTFPPGLSVNSDAARIEGTPTQAGTYRFYLTATLFTCPYPCGSKCSSDDEFIINVNLGVPKLTLGPEQSGVAVATVATPYSLQMTSSVADPKTWTINSGSLPPGLAINAATGLISGTPSTAGAYTFEVRAQVNADGRADTKVLGITVRDPLRISAPVDFFVSGVARTEVGVPVSTALTATGGAGTYTWSTTGDLPDGVTLVDGTLEGTPELAGVYRFGVSVTDAEGRTAVSNLTVRVAAKLAISTLALRDAKVGRFYRARIATTGGVAPKLFRIVRGPLPRGISFDRFTGVLSGFARKPGNYRITFEARDALSVKHLKTLRLKVVGAPKPARKR